MALRVRKASRVEKSGSLQESPLPNSEEDQFVNEFEHIVVAQLEALYDRIKTAHRNQLARLSTDGKQGEPPETNLQCAPLKPVTHALEDSPKLQLQCSEDNGSCAAPVDHVDGLEWEHSLNKARDASSKKSTNVSKKSTSRRASIQKTSTSTSERYASLSHQLVLGIEAMQGDLYEVTKSVVDRSSQPPVATPGQLETNLSRIVHHPLLHNLIVFTICTNASTIAAQTEWRAHNVGSTEPIIFEIIDTCCIAIFVVELGLKLALYRSSYFTNADYKWNLFDFVLVVFALVELLMKTLSSSVAIPGATLLRSLRLMRIVRTVRALRVAAVFKELRMMVSSILNCALAFSWLILLLAFVMFVCSVFITHGVTDHKQSQGPDYDLETRWLDDNFGSLSKSGYSLFKIISNGRSWGIYADHLFRISPLSACLLVLYIAFITFALLNIVTGIFVNFSMRAAEEDADNMALEYAGKRLKMIDAFCAVFSGAANDSGLITVDTFRAAFDDPRVRSFFHFIDLDVSLYAPDKIFKLLDFDGDQAIDLKEFVTGLSKFRGSARALDLAALHSDLTKVNRMLADVFRRMESEGSDSECTNGSNELTA